MCSVLKAVLTCMQKLSRFHLSRRWNFHPLWRNMGCFSCIFCTVTRDEVLYSLCFGGAASLVFCLLKDYDRYMYVFGFQLLYNLLVFSPLQIQKSYTWRHTSMHIAASSYLVYKSSLYFSSFETMMYCDKHDSTQTEGALSKINCKKFFEGSENIPTHPSLL